MRWPNAAVHIAFGTVANFYSLVQATDEGPTVLLNSGLEIIGHGGTVDSFLGIPYADVVKRFGPSKVILDIPDGVAAMNATEFGPICLQGPNPFEHLGQGMSEDCLTLNVWRPVVMKEKAPVMVWIHGGAFVTGSGSESLYDGTSLAKEGGVITITLNYRLGIFGFLAAGPGAAGGMGGIGDQINALKWIHTNIAAFGGDPDNITVFGESAGGISACLLSISPAAAGLFRRVIMQSGPCWGQVPVLPSEVGSLAASDFLQKAGVEDMSDLEDLTGEEVLALSFEHSGNNFYPTIEGNIMPGDPLDLYHTPGAISPTDILIGTTSFDDFTILFMEPSAYVNMTSKIGSIVNQTYYSVYGAAAVAKILEAYSPELYENSTVAAAAQLNGDQYFRCPSRELAAIAANNIEGSVYLYNFAHFTPSDPGYKVLQLAGIENKGWASHTSEIPFVFGNLEYNAYGEVPQYNPTDEDMKLKTEMVAFWTNFATTGNPNSEFNNLWKAVPTNIPASLNSASDVPTFVLQGGGGVMSDVPEKMKQCTAMPGVPSMRSADMPIAEGTETLKSAAYAMRTSVCGFVLGMLIFVSAM